MKSHVTLFDKYPVLNTIPHDKFPKHILIIPDGNGRWAKKRKKFVLAGHKVAVRVIDDLLHDLSDIKYINNITIWGFSADNWKRSEREISGLFYLMNSFIEKYLDKLKQRNGRFVHIGRKDRISKKLLNTINKAEKETQNNNGQIVSLAIDFGGEDQQIRLLEKAIGLAKNVKVNSDLLWQLRDGNGLVPHADLLIRSSGEIRISDVGWLNGAPTELYFIDKLFPDITISDIINGIVEFSKRNRRMGARPK